ncbi:hypothetical protein ACLKA6_001028 [Drosophila palustris]
MSDNKVKVPQDNGDSSRMSFAESEVDAVSAGCAQARRGDRQETGEQRVERGEGKGDAGAPLMFAASCGLVGGVLCGRRVAKPLHVYKLNKLENPSTL